MANNPYTSQAISGFNASPPSDDGSQVDANEITWAKHIDKIGTPLKNLAESINTNIVTMGTKLINTDADEQNAMAGSLAFTSKNFTIASGAITPTRTHVILAAETGTTDTLDTMATTSISDGGIIILKADTGDTITINDASGSAGQIHLVDSADLNISGNDHLVVKRDGADWYEIFRSVRRHEILQVLQTVKSDTFTTTSATYTDVTGVSQAITPSSSANKVLVRVSGHYSVAGAAASVFIQLVRDSTAISIGDAASNRTRASAGGRIAATTDVFPFTIEYLDSPATTSAVTYKIQALANAQTFVLNRSGADTDDAAHGRYATTITVMEIRP